MDLSNSRQSRRYYLRRPTSLEDFELIEHYIGSVWKYSGIYGPLNMAAFNEKSAGWAERAFIPIDFDLPHKPLGSYFLNQNELITLNKQTSDLINMYQVPFYSTNFGRLKYINPHAKNWCFYILEDDINEIHCIIFQVIIRRSAEHNPNYQDVLELLTSNLTWNELYVPNPAHRGDQGLYFYCFSGDLDPLEDRKKINIISSFIAAWFLHDAKLRYYKSAFTRTFTEHKNDINNLMLSPNPSSSDVIVSRLHRFSDFRNIAITHTETNPSVSVTVWGIDNILFTFGRLVDHPNDIYDPLNYDFKHGEENQIILNLSRTYQALSQISREELIYLINGYSVADRATSTRLSKRTIEHRRLQLRETFSKRSPSGLDLNQLARSVGLENGKYESFLDLISNPRFKQILNDIAWFYGELPRFGYETIEIKGN